ncbi:MAG: 1-deoxy-D-xylulose-5-phosphate reductoisomerase [Vitreoscilla sp.]|nr:1-deoxy-D-xylulose-5-phosphate reductoisomerase [Vitreoscilla sp.]MBP9539823.1 1-deoxy-D-xylulose-5-phosphate reductoisomerase [Vitreoscilla sp.]
MKQVISILGATGSIGDSTLDIVRRHRDQYEVFALAGNRQWQKLLELCVEFQPRYVVVMDEDVALSLKQGLQAASCATEVLLGQEGLCEIASATEVTMVMAAIVGAAGLPSAMAAAKAGKTILLANKETLVVSGQLFMDTVREHGARVLPVDSEHNAVFQVLPQELTQHGRPITQDLADFGIQGIILTASGGPFWQRDVATMQNITPKEAVKHPNWSMGQKISVDSASMMNKGLELIEARWLFNAKPSELTAVIHPQSVIHSMVRYRDGSVLAQLGTPDMRTPIAYCMGEPKRMDSGVTPLDFTTLSQLTFAEPDLERFPCLRLAMEALASGGDAPCVLNAANEVAVAAFLQQQIGFTDIARVVEQVLAEANTQISHNIDDLLAKDAWARVAAQQQLLQV